MNIVHAVLSLDCGGLERLVLHLCHEGISCGDKITVLCLDRPGDLAEEVRKTGAAVVTLSRKPGIMRPAEAIRLRKLLRKLSPDVVHCHQMGAALYVGSMARTLNIPAILHTEHGNHDYKGWRRRFLALCAFSMAHKLYGVSREITDNLYQSHVLVRRHPILQANGIPLPLQIASQSTSQLRDRLGIEKRAAVIGSVGRLVKVKRQERLVEATASLVKRGQDVHLLLVGDGPRHAELKKRAGELALEERVHFVGFQADPFPYLNLMDLFVLSSDSEGMPMALLEAWAAKKAVVVSAVGGLPDLVTHGKSGMLFAPENRQQLVDTLEELMDDPQRRKQLGENGHALVGSRFSAAQTARTYRSAYLELVHRHSPSLN